MTLSKLFVSPTLYLGALIALQTTYATAASFELSQVNVNFDSNEIHILGSNLGEGPEVVIFDTFDSNLSVPGASLPKRASLIGEWSEFSEYAIPTFSSYGRSGSHSFKAYDGETQQANIIRLRFDGTQEFYVSYWVYLEGPDYFPGDLTSSPKTFPDDSSLKLLWVFDEDVKGHSSDVVLPTHVGYGIFYLAGNDGNMVTNVGNEWWSWDNWMRLSFWLKANPEDPTGPGIVHFDTLSKDKGHRERTYNVAVFDEDGPDTKQYRQMTFPGWVRSIQNSSTNLLYDDIYVSTGPNAAARVELGNAADLKDVSQLELLEVTSWSDTSIRANAPTIKKGSIKDLFLYVTNGEGVTNDKGIPLVHPPAQIKTLEIE